MRRGYWQIAHLTASCRCSSCAWSEVHAGAAVGLVPVPISVRGGAVSGAGGAVSGGGAGLVISVSGGAVGKAGDADFGLVPGG